MKRHCGWLAFGALALAGPPVARAEPEASETTASGPARSAAGRWSAFGGFTAHDFSAPGLHLGGEYALNAERRFRSLLSASLHLHHRANAETAVALHARWGQRYSSDIGLTVESFVGIGIQYTSYDTIAFEFEDSVGRAVEGSASRVAFAPLLVLGPGYDFAPSFGLPLQLYARPGVVVVYPELNQVFQLAAILELGLRWALGAP